MGTYKFTWAHPAEEVYVTGTFDNWTKSEKLDKIGNSFEKTVNLPNASEKIYYKVRGRRSRRFPFPSVPMTIGLFHPDLDYQTPRRLRIPSSRRNCVVLGVVRWKRARRHGGADVVAAPNAWDSCEQHEGPSRSKAATPRPARDSIRAQSRSLAHSLSSRPLRLSPVFEEGKQCC
ncbi:hypothetical protein CTA2_155 [Colletotrichum tanaceti]|nr:hypothetical protein CTA2_155 [Colletotrichum tanaceti]